MILFEVCLLAVGERTGAVEEWRAGLIALLVRTSRAVTAANTELTAVLRADQAAAPLDLVIEGETYQINIKILIIKHD